MLIRTEKFCSLSTSPVWQAWLFHFNADIYKRFIKRLMESRGCNHNKELMVELLAEIDRIPGGSDKLTTFLRSQYPYVIVDDNAPIVQTPAPINKAAVKKSLFEDYVPGIMTYPRRIVFDGPEKTLRAIVQSFVSDKIAHESIIIGERAYVEYLTQVDKGIMDRIPMESWQIKAWRVQN